MMDTIEKIKAIQYEALKTFEVNGGSFCDELNNINDIMSVLIRIENKIHTIITMIENGRTYEEEHLKDILIDLQKKSAMIVSLLEE